MKGELETQEKGDLWQGEIRGREHTSLSPGPVLNVSTWIPVFEGEGNSACGYVISKSRNQQSDDSSMKREWKRKNQGGETGDHHIE